MSDPVKSRIELLESLLKEITDAAYNVLVESNGLSDNEWKTADGTYSAEYPVKGYVKRLKDLDAAYTKASGYFDPPKAERSAKWSIACATASYVMDRYKQELVEGNDHPNLILSSLHRNIADAIYGTLICTPEQREAEVRPETMADRLHSLVAEGKLIARKGGGGGTAI